MYLEPLWQSFTHVYEAADYILNTHILPQNNCQWFWCVPTTRWGEMATMLRCCATYYGTMITRQACFVQNPTFSNGVKNMCWFLHYRFWMLWVWILNGASLCKSILCSKEFIVHVIVHGMNNTYQDERLSDWTIFLCHKVFVECRESAALITHGGKHCIGYYSWRYTFVSPNEIRWAKFENRISISFWPNTWTCDLREMLDANKILSNHLNILLNKRRSSPVQSPGPINRVEHNIEWITLLHFHIHTQNTENLERKKSTHALRTTAEYRHVSKTCWASSHSSRKVALHVNTVASSLYRIVWKHQRHWQFFWDSLCTPI